VKPHGYHYCDYTFLFNYHSPTSPRIFFAAAHVEHICVQFLSETHQCVLPYVRLILAVALFLFAVCKRIVDIAVILMLMCSTETLPVLFSIHIFACNSWCNIGIVSVRRACGRGRRWHSKDTPERRLDVRLGLRGSQSIPKLHLNFYLFPYYI